MLARDHANAYRSVCSTKAQTNLYSVNQPFTSYICDLISPEVRLFDSDLFFT